MESVVEFIEKDIIENLVTWGTIIAETIGIIIVIVAVIIALIMLLRKKDSHEIVSYLGNNFGTALTFMLAGEILHTVTAHSFESIGIVAATTALRMLIHYAAHHDVGHHDNAHEQKQKV